MIRICTNVRYVVLEEFSMEEIKFKIDGIVNECNNNYRNKVKKLVENGFIGVDEITSINLCELSGERKGLYTATVVINTYDYFMNEEEIKHPLVVDRPIERT